MFFKKRKAKITMNRRQQVQMSFWVSPSERDRIKDASQKMQTADGRPIGISAFIRAACLDVIDKLEETIGPCAK